MENTLKKFCVLLGLLLLFLPSSSSVEATSGNTEADVTFTQGDTPIIQPNQPGEIPPSTWHAKIQELLPKTGEIVNYLGEVIGVLLLAVICFLLWRKKQKNRIKDEHHD